MIPQVQVENLLVLIQFKLMFYTDLEYAHRMIDHPSHATQYIFQLYQMINGLMRYGNIISGISAIVNILHPLDYIVVHLNPDVMQRCNIWSIYRILTYNKVHGANMGPTWVLLARGGPHVGPMNLAIRASLLLARDKWSIRYITSGAIWESSCQESPANVICDINHR